MGISYSNYDTWHDIDNDTILCHKWPINNFMDTPAKKIIKIGKSSVGLVGLEIAFQQLQAKGDLSDTAATDFLFAAIRKQNYIPAGTEDLYRQALLDEYKRQRDTPAENDILTIRILGRPCVTCNKLKIMVIDLLQEMELAADIEDVQDLDEIWRYGITKTPALIINDEIKSAGIQPPRHLVEKWLRDASEQ